MRCLTVSENKIFIERAQAAFHDWVAEGDLFDKGDIFLDLIILVEEGSDDGLDYDVSYSRSYDSGVNKITINNKDYLIYCSGVIKIKNPS